MAIKVLFWISNFPNSMGESTNALLFAGKLNPLKYAVFFFAGARSKSYLESNRQRVLSLDEVLKSRFDLIIFSEYYHFLNLKFENPAFYSKISDYLKISGKIATFDTLNFGNKQDTMNKRLEEIPFIKTAYPGYLPPETKLSSIKVCPVNKPEFSGNGNYAWSLPKINGYGQSREKIRTVLGCPENTRIVLFSLSTWQYLCVPQKERSFFIFMVNYLTNVLQQLDKEIIFMVISPSEIILSGVHEKVFLKVFNIGQGNFLLPELYNQLLLSSDLIITLNLIQHSFVRSIVSGIPGLNLKSGKINAKSKNALESFCFMQELAPDIFSDLNRRYVKTDEPYKDSMFARLFETIDFSDEESLLENFKRQLFDESYLSNWQQNFHNFKMLLQSLPNEEKILDAILCS